MRRSTMSEPTDFRVELKIAFIRPAIRELCPKMTEETLERVAAGLADKWPLWLPKDSAIATLRTRLEQAERENAGLRAAVTTFLAKYAQVEPAMIDAFKFQYLHGMKYEGENWGAELTALREAIRSPQAPAHKGET